MSLCVTADRLKPGLRAFLPLLLSVFFACTTLAQEKLDSLYDGASVEFAQAQLIKPRENANLGLAFTVAPLLIQEVKATDSAMLPTRVFYHQDAVRLNEREHARLTYWWNYTAPIKSVERRSPARRGPDAPPLKHAGPEAGAPIQGVRVTLNTNGVPVVFEVLGERDGRALIYVSQFIETAAMAEFGLPLPGRRFVVERGLSEAPDIVVPRVIDDPPAVMGPIVYLRAGTHEVATLICRCMDSEAKSLVSQGFYELVPADFSGKVPPATRLEAAFPRWFRADFSNQTNRLARSLRLPRGF